MKRRFKNYKNKFLTKCAKNLSSWWSRFFFPHLTRKSFSNCIYQCRNQWEGLESCWLLTRISENYKIYYLIFYHFYLNFYHFSKRQRAVFKSNITRKSSTFCFSYIYITSSSHARVPTFKILCKIFLSLFSLAHLNVNIFIFSQFDFHL